MEKPQVTEIKVRIDCNGCVQKIKKALHNINGINDIYIDVPQQKLTIIGYADPEKILKAIKKTRKLAMISSEPQSHPPTEPPLKGCAPFEPPNEPENPPLEPEPAPPSSHSSRRQSPQHYRTKEAEEVHVVHHYPPDHGPKPRHERASVKHDSSPPSPVVYKHEPVPLQSIHVNHSYNTYKPTPHVTYYKHNPSPPQYTHYNQQPKSPQHFAHYNTPEPSHQQAHCIRPEPPQHYNKPEPPPQQTHYTRPEPPQQYTHYKKSEPPLQYTNYHKPDQYTQYNRSEQTPMYTICVSSTELPSSQYSSNYSGVYDISSNGNGNITSIFSDENPNACTIV